MAQKDAAIKHLKTENLLLKQTSRWCEITHSEENCKKMQDVADGKAQLHDEFPELQDNQRSTITAILTNPAIIIGFHFEHMWFVEIFAEKIVGTIKNLVPDPAILKVRLKNRTHVRHSVRMTLIIMTTRRHTNSTTSEPASTKMDRMFKVPTL